MTSQALKERLIAERMKGNHPVAVLLNATDFKELIEDAFIRADPFDVLKIHGVSVYFEGDVLKI